MNPCRQKMKMIESNFIALHMYVIITAMLQNFLYLRNIHVIVCNQFQFYFPLTKRLDWNQRTIWATCTIVVQCIHVCCGSKLYSGQNFFTRLILHFLCLLSPNNYSQRAKKVLSDSPGLVDFAIGLMNSVFNLPDGQWWFLRNSMNRRTVKSILQVKKFLGLVEMMSGLVNASSSLPKWQAVKMIFFAPWFIRANY